MLLLKAQDLYKRFGDRDLFTIPKFEIVTGDRIGIVGANGSGKTTLLRLLAGDAAPDGGHIDRRCEIAFIRQLEDAQGEAAGVYLSEFHVAQLSDAQKRSGGEDMRVRIAQALSREPALLFADEPAANLDSEGRALLSEKLGLVETLVLISHDRDLLDAQCTSIVELRGGGARFYAGNYSAFREQREAERQREQFEYEEYISEKARLEDVARDKRKQAKSMRKAPKGMSNSEAKMRSYMMLRKPDVKEKSLAQAAKAVEKRLERLEVKEKPRDLPTVRINFSLTDPPMGRTIAESADLSFSYGDNVIFDGASFRLPNREKIALTGNNGSGKTTFLHLLAQGHPAIRMAPKARIGYFRQDMGDIDLDKTILQNTLRDAVQSENVARSLLARLLFRADEVHKKAAVLSGGERIRLSLAMLLTKPCNVLLLDEPTNYLDMPSIEAVQELLREYEGTLLFVSHDGAFTRSIATASLHAGGKKLHWNAQGVGTRARPPAAPSSERLLLELKKAQLVSRFGDPGCDPAALKKELAEIDQMLKACDG